jgi:hypothetical protein
MFIFVTLSEWRDGQGDQLIGGDLVDTGPEWVALSQY